MRFRIKLFKEGVKPKVIPVNYQYPISAWIYSTLKSADAAFAGKIDIQSILFHIQTGSKAETIFEVQSLNCHHEF